MGPYHPIHLLSYQLDQLQKSRSVWQVISIDQTKSTYAVKFEFRLKNRLRSKSDVDVAEDLLGNVYNWV